MIPGLFPYEAALDSEGEYSLIVPWAFVGGACSETIHVAVHADVQTFDGSLDESAWAAGPFSSGADWSSWFDTTICCEE